ncbi:putative ankyrin repeat protein RF_0381 [Leptopilina heterotoma]|uniref:putative ankyrin repeat protein RF_0381 n=1 Tax=Leptopilina heterotoma TaxID=63436 RepID=UPI001CAA01B7|nr:putative ankyrin repeat protein RF_0381 [Leptopilina heterotoma]
MQWENYIDNDDTDDYDSEEDYSSDDDSDKDEDEFVRYNRLLEYLSTLRNEDIKSKENEENKVFLFDEVAKVLLKILDLLMKKGADDNVNDVNVEVAEFLAKMDVDERKAALKVAIEKGKLEMVKLFMSNGFDKLDVEHYSCETPLGVAVVHRQLDILKYLLESGLKIKEDLINLCTHDKHIDILKFLLDFGIKQDYVEDSLLDLSFLNDKLKLWRYVLTCNSKIDAVLTSKETELHSAVRANQIESVEEILNKVNVNPLPRELGQFAVYIAVENGNEEMLKTLLEAGCSVESCFNDKLTPLHVAATFEHTRLVEILLKYGANVNSETTGHFVPLDFAVTMGHLNMIKLLLASGANPIKDQKNYSLLENILRDYKKESITPSMFENIFKITEFLLGVIVLKHENKYHIHRLLINASNLRISPISDKNDQISISEIKEDKKGEFRLEIVRCLLNYLTGNILEVVLNLQLNFNNNSSMIDIFIEYYNLKFLRIEYFSLKKNWSCFFVINQIENDSQLFIMALSLNDNVFVSKKTELFKLIIARLELLPSGSQKLVDRLHSREDILIIKEFQNECRQQIIILQKTKVIDDLNVTFYDILVKSTDKIANYMRNEKLLNTIELSYDKFPAYAKFLTLRIEQAKRKIDLIDMSMNCLLNYIKRNYNNQISVFDLGEVLKFLSMSDLRKLSTVFTKLY